MTDRVGEALEQFVYNNPELEQLEALLDDFNPFVALRWTRQEARHSSFLRWLLDPSETHGLGSYFLRTFLKRLARESESVSTEVPTVFDVDGWDLSDSRVYQEWQNIDVLIRDDTLGLMVAIENKVDTSEHGRQLQRYRAVLEKQFPKYRRLFAYLTISGDPPSDDAYVPISHAEIAELIDQTLERRGDQLAPDVEVFLGHYVEMLRRHILEDSEIQRICEKIYNNHRLALDVLFEHRPDRAMEVSEFLQDLVEEMSGLIPDHSSKANIRFIPNELDFLPPVSEGWTRTGRILLFEFENYASKVRLKLVLGPGEASIRDRIRAAIENHPEMFNRANQRVSPKWWSVHTEGWITARQYDELELEELKSVLREKLHRFCNNELPKMISALEPLASELDVGS